MSPVATSLTEARAPAWPSLADLDAIRASLAVANDLLDDLLIRTRSLHQEDAPSPTFDDVAAVAIGYQAIRYEHENLDTHLADLKELREASAWFGWTEWHDRTSADAEEST